MSALRLFPLFLFFQYLIGPFSPVYAQGEAVYSLSGKLEDVHASPVAYATVSLLTADSSFVHGSISSEAGSYVLTDVPPGAYRLQVEHLEYTTFTSDPFSLTTNRTNPAITLEIASNALREHVVSARKAVVEVRADRLVFNVGSSPAASGTNGLEVLRKVPGVRVDMDDNISLLGKGDVRIYLNGVATELSGADLSSFLQSLTTENIETIEVIANPPARYEAAGSSIIDIRTKRDLAYGFNGTVGGSFTQGEYLRYSTQTQLNYGGERTKANFSFNRTDNRNVDGYRDEKLQQASRLRLDSREVTDLESYHAALGVEFRLSPTQYLNLNGRAVFADRAQVLRSTTDIFDRSSDTLQSVLRARALGRQPSDNLTAGLSHHWTISPGTDWDSALSVGRYTADNRTDQPNTFLGPDRTTLLGTDNTAFAALADIELWSVKTDLTKTLKRTTLEAGAKYGRIFSQNDFSFYRLHETDRTLDPQLSNDFSYAENVTALYGAARVSVNEALDFDVGLRVEHTASRGVLEHRQQLADDDVSRRYTDFFHSAGINLKRPHYSLSLRVGRRITRPNYQDLNPFEKPLSRLVVWKGNPFLKPSYTLTQQLTLVYREKLTLIASYNRDTDLIATLFEITGERDNQIIPRNMSRAGYWNLSIHYPFQPLPNWEVGTFTNIGHKHYQGSLNGVAIDLTNTYYDLLLENNIQLPGDFLLNVSGNIWSRWIWRGTISVRGNARVDVGLRKDVLDGRLQLRLTGSDIFQTTNNYYYRGNYGGIQLDGVRYFDSQRFGAGATLKFGNEKAKTKRQDKEAFDGELRRID